MSRQSLEQSLDLQLLEGLLSSGPDRMEVDQREGLRQDLRQGPDVATVAAEEVCTVDCTAAGSQMVVAEMANTVAGTVVGPVA